MLCSGCGKDIPFYGAVCPYCQRDKSKDKAFTENSFAFGIIGAVIGYFIFGFWGVLGGLFIGFVIAALTSGNSTEPPEVQTTHPPAPQIPPPTDDSVEVKLTQLKQLHEQGLITSEEFSRKKSEILSKF